MHHRAMSEDRASLERLEGPQGLQALLIDLLQHRNRGEAVRSVGWQAPRWRLRPDGSLWWSRTVDVVLTDGTAEAEAEVVFPWLLDDAARAAAAEVRLPGGAPLYVGDHDGLFAGRPLVPVAQAGRRPGLHVVRRPAGSRLDDAVAGEASALLHAEVWPVHGPVAVPGRRPSAGACRGAASAEADPAEAVRSALGCTSRRWLPRTVAEAVAADLRLGPGEDVWAAVDASVHELSGRAELATAPGSTELRRLEHVLMDVVFEAAGAAWRCDQSRDVAGLAHALTALSEQALRAFVARRGRFGSLVRADADTDTLARIEHRRTVTFQHGTHGQPGRLRGRTDLRQLHPGWNGTLCPLQTPESQSIGLVRHRAAGALVTAPTIAGRDLSQWSDVSLGAALVPFLGHDDPARSAIGAKNLKQAVPVVQAGIPAVRTGVEAVVAEEAGVLRAPVDGRVTGIGPDSLVLELGGRRTRLGFGPAWPGTSGVVTDWTVHVAEGELVRTGRLLATAPDVRLDPDGSPHLALGVDAFVALAPWHGWNYEDGIVVSESLAARMTSHHERTFTEALGEGEVLVELVAIGTRTPATGPVAEVRSAGAPPRPVRLPEAGEYCGLDGDGQTVRYRALRPLQVGDKLSNRHGGKGVVSRVLPDEEMPRTAAGHRIDALLNPLGVLRRLNIGQVLEMNVSLRDLLRGSGPTVVDRRLADRSALNAELAAAGAPGGRLPLLTADGEPIGPEEGVVVGYQHLVKLDHMAVDKLSVRTRGGRSPRTGQPQQTASWHGGRRQGAAQRLGEMELWALQAAGATEVLRDALEVRGVAGTIRSGLPQTLRAVDAHLRVAGMELVLPTSDGEPADLWGTDPEQVAGIGVRPSSGNGPRASHGGPLQPIDGPTQLAFARWAGFSGGTEPNPLTHRLDHGTGDGREQVQWVIPLAVPVPHPWRLRRQEPSPLPDLTVLPVLPPAFLGAGGYALDRAYLSVCRVNGQLLKIDELVAAKPEMARPTAAQRVGLERRLALAVEAVLGSVTDTPDQETIAARLGGKTGLLRRWLLGRATEFSGRAVIVPDPERDPQTLGVPAALFDAVVAQDPDDPHAPVVVLNRQPTLHPYNLIAFRAERVPGHAIHLHPLVLTALAGDHDGDTVALHAPVTRAARADAWARLRPATHLVGAATGRSLAKLDLDVALGLLLRSRDEAGRAALSRELGRPVPGPLTPAALSAWVEDQRSAEVDPDRTVDWLARLLSAGWSGATTWGFSVVDLPTGTALGAAADPQEAVARALLDAPSGTPLGRLAQAQEAGVAGGLAALTQLLARRGHLPGPNPLLPLPDCPDSLLTGLSADQLPVAAAGGLGRLADKKLMTPVAGAFTKVLAEITYDVAVDRTDCGTAAPVRSPLSCADVQPCAGCYGADPETGETVRPGRRVGLLAAMVIGERGTQLAMKTFHGGGSGGNVGGDLTRLRALLGEGRSADLARLTGHDRLGDHLAALPSSATGEQVHAHLWPVVEQAVTILGGAVGGVHLAVVLRQLWDTARGSARPLPALARAAERRGRGPFELATLRGALTALLTSPGQPAGEDANGRPDAPPDSQVPSARTRLLLGVAR